MIVSASRRTDIPALYAEWFMNRVRAGFCEVVNPFDRKRSMRVDLRPESVEAIVFWTRHAAPLLPHLAALCDLGFRYYFLYTVLDYPRELDPRSPDVNVAIDAFRRLVDQIGPERVAWRYDPIVLSKDTDVRFHLERFERIALQFKGYTRRCIVSFVNHYRKTERRMNELAPDFRCAGKPDEPTLRELVPGLHASAAANGISIQSCAEEVDLRPFGVAPGKCIDDDLIRRVLGVEVTSCKDKGQRKTCRCVTSRDIGAYDTCVMGCRYCYATSSFDLARQRYSAHDPEADVLVKPAPCSVPVAPA